MIGTVTAPSLALEFERLGVIIHISASAQTIFQTLLGLAPLLIFQYASRAAC
jgi:hypothetical protein